MQAGSFHKLLQKHTVSEYLILRDAEGSQLPVVLGQSEFTQPPLFFLHLFILLFFFLCEKDLYFGVASAFLTYLNNATEQPGNRVKSVVMDLYF